MSRNDISDFLIHFTKGAALEDAFDCLGQIVRECTLLGSGRVIRGGYPCVCFTEAPLIFLDGAPTTPGYFSRYSPFGIMIQKQWLFHRGGRPVIYEPEAEFQALPETHKWRHVRYEPPMIDFGWEREWRIQRDALQFDRESAAIIVPDQSWAQRLTQQHEDEQECNVMQYSLIVGDTLAQLCFDPFQWNIITLT